MYACSCYITLFLEDINKFLFFFPDREPSTNQSMDIAKVQLDEPTDLGYYLYKKW